MKINLQKGFFGEKERELLTHGEMSVSAFRYDSGVEALRIKNKRGYFIFLPFQGQQVWKLNIDGNDISMKTTIPEPVPTEEYLKTYGGFMYHCGISAFGMPQADDTHPQHGETPNIAYKSAHIICGEDGQGRYIAVGGTLDYDIAFTRKYRFSPECRMYEDGTLLHISIALENLRSYPMEYMYLCHLNFRPQNGARLVYSAKRDAGHIKLHRVIPDSLPEAQKARLAAYMDKISENPAVCDDIGNPDEIYDPEICFAIKYEADEEGRAYTMQYKKGEGAYFVSHPADVLPVGVRWISRTKNEDALGMVLPATAEHLGYSDSRRKGYIKTLAAGETLRFRIDAGFLDEGAAAEMCEKINGMIK